MHTKTGGLLQGSLSEGKSRLLVVDDEVHIRSSLVKALTLVGYAVDEAASGQEALTLLQEEPYDLMVLDMVMPGVEGLDVLRQAHRVQPDVSIIILTGNATLESAIAAVKSAAVDYLLKPASIHEIIDAVTNALQKRAASAQKDLLVNVFGEALERVSQSELSSILAQLPQMSEARFVVAHSLQLDRLKRVVILDGGNGESVDLSKGEAAVLRCLMQHADQVLSCEQLVWLAWGYETDSIEAENVIRPYIFRLRKKLDDDPKKTRLIHTVRKRGYKFALINR
jgi:two-component system, OmpR family, response regulator